MYCITYRVMLKLLSIKAENHPARPRFGWFLSKSGGVAPARFAIVILRKCSQNVKTLRYGNFRCGGKIDGTGNEEVGEFL